MSATVSQRDQYRTVRLGEILRVRNDIVHPRDNPKGSATFVGLEHIESGTGRRIGAIDVDMEVLTGRKPKFFRGDIVYGYLRPYLNKVWVADFDGLCSVDQYVYEVSERADAHFVASFMRSPLYFQRAPTGITPGQLPRIRKEEVATVDMEFPPLAEQKRIAGILKEQLAAVARARAAAQAQLAAAKALPAAYLREVFDSAEGREWPMKPLLDWCEANGQYGTSENACDDPNAGLPVLRMGNLIDGRIDWSNLRYMVLPQDEEAKYRLRDGDVIFNRTNSAKLVGKTAVFEGDRPAVFASYLIRFRLRPDVGNPHFVSAYINSRLGRDFMEANMTRAIGQANISASVMHKMPIPCPPVEQQNQIATSLRERGACITALSDAIQLQSREIDAAPAALLRSAFQRRL